MWQGGGGRGGSWARPGGNKVQWASQRTAHWDSLLPPFCTTLKKPLTNSSLRFPHPRRGNNNVYSPEELLTSVSFRSS